MNLQIPFSYAHMKHFLFDCRPIGGIVKWLATSPCSVTSISNCDFVTIVIAFIAAEAICLGISMAPYDPWNLLFLSWILGTTVMKCIGHIFLQLVNCNNTHFKVMMSSLLSWQPSAIPELKYIGWFEDAWEMSK